MTDIIFHSRLAQDISSFIEQKRSAGYPYNTSARVLSYLDRMISEKFPKSSFLSKEICDAWIAECSELHPNTLLRRVTPVRQLGRYLSGMGLEAYIIPSSIPGRQIHYDAHIFTEEELSAFFRAIDKCRKSPFAPYRCYVIPVIFRLVFTCGLRSSEARLLKTSDVNLENGKIYIRSSKGWEARIVYASSELLDLLVRYDRIISRAFPDREAFFVNSDGVFYSKSTLDTWFHEFWDPLPEASAIKGNPPRVHDFRHSYCVYRINRWMKDNKDMNALYPYLSEFLGHSNYADTDYYITLTESFYPEFNSRMRSVNEHILPEVLHEN